MAAPEQSPAGERVVGDLWRFYEEHATQARQHETLRATVTSILTGFAAALVGLASVGGLETSDVPAGVVIMVAGLLGGLLSLKHYERNRFHTEVMKTVRDHIAELRRDPQRVPRTTGDLRRSAKKQHEDTFSLREKKKRKGSWLVRTHLFQLWLALDLIVAAVGAVIVVASST